MVFLCLSVCEQSLLEQLPQDDPDYIYNMGCLLYQDNKYEEACKKFMSAMQVLGYVPGTHPKTCAHMKMPSVVLIVILSRFHNTFSSVSTAENIC